MKKIRPQENLLIGLLLFGLFFGAGNIIFPAYMGQLSGKNYILSSIGFILTAAGLPILSVISYSLSEKNSLFEYSSRVGKFFSHAFPVLLLLTIGPLFAIPRTRTVAFEVGIKFFIKDNISKYLLIYSTIFFSITLLLSLKPNKLVDIIGKFLSPFFIGLISILIIVSFINPLGKTNSIPIGEYLSHPFLTGIIDGYETMDVLAGLAFGMTIIDNIKLMGVNKPIQIIKETGKSSFFTIVFMTLIYGGLAHLGASSINSIGLQENGGFVIANSSQYLLGNFGIILLAITITIACLKTSIGLVVSIGSTFDDAFTNGKRYKYWAIAFTLISFIFSNFGLNTIVSWSIPVLMFLYPIAILLVFLWIIDFFIPLKDIAFKFSIIVILIPALLDLLYQSPSIIKEIALVNKIITKAESFIPLYSQGLAWLIPGIIVILISIMFLREKKKDI